MTGSPQQGGIGAAPGLHVIFGTGPVGCSAAALLLEKGKRVRMVNRSGKHPDGAFMGLAPELEARIEFVSADARDWAAVSTASRGATHLYHCVNVLYQEWEKILPVMHANIVRAATESGALFAAAENLYMFARGVPVIDEKTPVDPPSHKGRLIQRLHENLIDAGVRGALQMDCGSRFRFLRPPGNRAEPFRN
jgi:hypothetical protein